MGKTLKSKRAYIGVVRNKTKYMLFKDDIRKAFKVRKLRAPPVPSYDPSDPPKDNESDTYS